MKFSYFSSSRNVGDQKTKPVLETCSCAGGLCGRKIFFVSEVNGSLIQLDKGLSNVWTGTP